MTTYRFGSKWGKIVRIGLLAALALSACRPLDTPAPPPGAQGAVEVKPTATAAPTHTPPPTETPIPTATATLLPTHTPLPPATATPDMAATQAAQATQTVEPLLGMINAQLSEFNLSTDQGYFGGFGEPIELTVDSYQESTYGEPYPGLSVSDFVLHTRARWHTSSGLAGCGLLFRADRLGTKHASLYEIMLVRLQNAPFMLTGLAQDGRYVNEMEEKFSNDINDEQDSVNELVLVVRGDTYSLYANGEKVWEGAARALDEGALTFTAFQESGKTTCTFSDTWLWILDAPK